MRRAAEDAPLTWGRPRKLAFANVVHFAQAARYPGSQVVIAWRTGPVALLDELRDVLKVLTAPSGSVGPWTVSRNAHGPYIRARVTPTYVLTSPRSLAQNRLIAAANRWASRLTPAERDSWRVYAAGVPMRHSTGPIRRLTGFQQWMRTNVAARTLGTPYRQTAPLIQNVGYFSPVRIEVIAGQIVWRAYYDSSDPWYTSVNGGCMIYRTHTLSPTITSFKPPYAVQANIRPGDPNPKILGLIPGTTAGRSIFVRLYVIQHDGRVSYDQRTRTIIA